MRLLRLEVQNFCQHRHRVVEFNPRLTVFLGQNGSGKSNLLTAALAALTNDFSRTHGNKAENICQTAPEDEPAYVRLTIEHNGSEVEIQRGLRKATTYWRQGEDTVRGDTAVTDRVMEFLGTTKRIVNDYLFVEQGEIYTPLVCKAADRARAFQQLFGTGHAEKCWKALGEYIASIGATEVSLLDMDTLRQELETVRGRVVELATDLAGIDLPTDYTPATDPASQVIAKWDALLTAIAAKQEAEPGVAKETTVLATLEAELTTLVVDGSAVAAAIAAIQDAYEEASVSLQTWELREQAVIRVTKLQTARTTLLQERAANSAPEEPETYVSDVTAWQHQTAVREVKRAKHQQMVEALDTDSGVVECPTCGTSVADLEMDIEYARVEYSKLTAVVEERNDAYHATVAHNTAYTQWESADNARQTRIAAVEDALADEDGVDTADTLSEDAAAKLRAVVTLMGERTAVRAAITEEISELRSAIAIKTAEVLSKQTTVEAFSNTIADLSAGLDEQVAAAAKEQLSANQIGYAERIRLQGQHAEAETSVFAAEARMHTAEVRAEQAANDAEFVEHLDTVRAVLHRDSLPKLVAQNYLELLELDMNEILESFSTDFRVSARDGLGFIADFPDGRSQPVPRLSGGQKVILALAFRIAVNSLFAADLGVITLDEPTAYLDDENIDCLDTALSRLRSLSESRGLQCILITHEKGLGHLFDHVVQL
jgi:DNA repair exonuclease SbcCD ATPase subunit